MADKRKRTSGGKNKRGGGFISGVVEQTTHMAGEVWDSAASMTNMARETSADWVRGVSPTAAEVLRPGKRRQKTQARRASAKTSAGKAAAGVARATRKTTARASKATTRAAKTASKTATRVTRSASKGGRSKGSKKR